MLVGGGQWNGKRLLSRRPWKLMSSRLRARTPPGARARAEAMGLSVEVVSDSVAAAAAFPKAASAGTEPRTHFWVDRKRN